MPMAAASLKFSSIVLQPRWRAFVSRAEADCGVDILGERITPAG